MLFKIARCSVKDAAGSRNARAAAGTAAYTAGALLPLAPAGTLPTMTEKAKTALRAVLSALIVSWRFARNVEEIGALETDRLALLSVLAEITPLMME